MGRTQISYGREGAQDWWCAWPLPWTQPGHLLHFFPNIWLEFLLSHWTIILCLEFWHSREQISIMCLIFFQVFEECSPIFPHLLLSRLSNPSSFNPSLPFFKPVLVCLNPSEKVAHRFDQYRIKLLCSMTWIHAFVDAVCNYSFATTSHCWVIFNFFLVPFLANIRKNKNLFAVLSIFAGLSSSKHELCWYSSTLPGYYFVTCPSFSLLYLLFCCFVFWFSSSFFYRPISFFCPPFIPSICIYFIFIFRNSLNTPFSMSFCIMDFVYRCSEFSEI